MVGIFLKRLHISGAQVLAWSLCLLALGLSACGSSGQVSSSDASANRQGPLLNTKRVELAIEQSVLVQRDLHAQAFCPSQVQQMRGQTFICLAYAPKVRPAAFTVRQIDDAGRVQYSSK